jgi:hypothetical protein
MTVRAALAVLIIEAEATLRSYKEDMDAWSYAEYDGHKYTHEELAPDLCVAIKNARELLERSPDGSRTR